MRWFVNYFNACRLFFLYVVWIIFAVVLFQSSHLAAPLRTIQEVHYFWDSFANSWNLFPDIDIVRGVLNNDPRLLLWNVISASECKTYVRRYGTYDKWLCTRKGHEYTAGHESGKLSVRIETFMALIYFHIFYDMLHSLFVGEAKSSALIRVCRLRHPNETLYCRWFTLKKTLAIFRFQHQKYNNTTDLKLWNKTILIVCNWQFTKR